MNRFRHLDEQRYALERDELERLLSPTLLIYTDRVQRNISRMREYLDDDLDRWRPHVKTTKIPQVFRRLILEGVRHFKCATTREARLLLKEIVVVNPGPTDVLVAYPHVGPALQVLGRLASGFPSVRLSVLCEDVESLAEIPESLGVWVDVNPGMHRTGIPLAEPSRVVDVVRESGSRFQGIHFYDGHLHEGAPGTRRRQAFMLYGELLALHETLQRQGLIVPEICTSGTPTFRHAVAYEAFGRLNETRHRVSPGTVVYHDTRSARLAELDLVPAALVLSRVISRPKPGRITCDAGSKAIAAEAGNPCVEVLGHPELRALPPSEEHLPFEVAGGFGPKRGTPLLLIPHHVCPTINLAEEAVFVEKGRVTDIVSVTARAHDVLAE